MGGSARGAKLTGRVPRTSCSSSAAAPPAVPEAVLVLAYGWAVELILFIFPPCIGAAAGDGTPFSAATLAPG